MRSIPAPPSRSGLPLVFGWIISRGLSLVAVLVIAACVAGCRPGESAGDVTVTWDVQPDPPQVGLTSVRVALSDSAGSPIQGGAVDLEATMTHPGMRPEMAAAEEIEPGLYEADLNLTMAGDWMLILNAELPDGGAIQRQHELRGVRTP